MHQIQALSHALSGTPIDYLKVGKITGESCWSQFTWRFIGKPDARLLRVVGIAKKAFEEREAEGALLFEETALLSLEAQRYRSSISCLCGLVDKIQKALVALGRSASKPLKEEVKELEGCTISLTYLVEDQNGRVKKLESYDQARYAALKQAAKVWKAGEPLALDKKLNSLELKQLEEAACYPLWVDWLLAQPKQKADFFKFCLRDYNPPWFYILYPVTANRVKKALLASQLGYVRRPEDEPLQVGHVKVTEGVYRKIVTIPVYQGGFKFFNRLQQTRVNILDPTEKVWFKNGNYHLTVGEIFRQSGERNAHEVPINLSAYGFVNFHPVHGPWDADDQNYPQKPSHSTSWNEVNWLHLVPPARIATSKELTHRYGDLFEKRAFFYAVGATRQCPDLTSTKCHAFNQLYVRCGAGDEWKVLNIGYYAYRFQTNLKDGLELFCATVERVVCFMDQNGYYSMRQRAIVPFFPDEPEASAYCKRLFLSFRQQAVFQFSGRNCAYNVQKLVVKSSGSTTNFFCISLLDAPSGIGFIDGWARLAARIGPQSKAKMYHMLRTILGAHRGVHLYKKGKYKWYSVKEFFKNKGGILFNPAFLHQQILQKKLSGSVCWSHTEEALIERPEMKERVGL